MCRRLEHWCWVPASSIITPSSIFLFLFFNLYRISGNVKVLRSLTDVQAHLQQHPDPRVDFSKFNSLEKYFQATPLHEALALEGKAADTAEPLVDDSLPKYVVKSPFLTYSAAPYSRKVTGFRKTAISTWDSKWSLTFPTVT